MHKLGQGIESTQPRTVNGISRTALGIARNIALVTTLTATSAAACTTFGSAVVEPVEDGGADRISTPDSPVGPISPSDGPATNEGAVPDSSHDTNTNDAEDKDVRRDAADPDGGPDAQADATDPDADPDTSRVDAADAATPPPFVNCVASFGGASIAPVYMAGANSNGGMLRVIAGNREDYALGGHYFNLISQGTTLPAVAVVSGNGNTEMSFDPSLGNRLGAQTIYTTSLTNIQDKIPNCAGAGIESQPCLSRLLDALQCEEIKTTPPAGCPAVTIGFTNRGKYTTYTASGATQNLVFSVIHCPPL